MNKRFEDTYVKATNEITGMARDYRLLEERHRLLVHRCEVEQDTADDLRGKVSELLAKATQPIDCENCPHQHPEYHEAKFSLSSEFPEPDVRVPPGGCCQWRENERTVEHEESDIDLAVPEYDEKRMNVGELLDAHKRSFPYDEEIIQRLATPAPKAPMLYGNFFDVLAWRWVFNTVGHTPARW